MAKKQNKHVIEGVKYLAQEHINKLESFNKDEEIKKLELEVINEKASAMSEKRQKLSAQLEVVNKELEILTLSKKILTYEHNIKGNSYRSFIEMLKKEYELGDTRFGFDPESGEIKE